MEISNDSKKFLKKVRKERFDAADDEIIEQLLRAGYVRRNYYVDSMDVCREDANRPFSITEDGKAYLESQRRAMWRYIAASILVPLAVGAFSGIATSIILALLNTL